MLVSGYLTTLHYTRGVFVARIEEHVTTRYTVKDLEGCSHSLYYHVHTATAVVLNLWIRIK
jgi:hypothetical protein